MRGLKATPTTLKLIKGTARANPREPRPALEMPLPPQHLSDEARIESERLSEDLLLLGLITHLD